VFLSVVAAIAVALFVAGARMLSGLISKLRTPASGRLEMPL
jgi:hypothetical protein